MILREAIERYVLWRRAHGAKFTTGANLLRHFLDHADGDAACDAVTPGQVLAYLAGEGPPTRHRENKCYALAGFWRHAISRGHAALCNDNCDGWLATIRLSGLRLPRRRGNRRTTISGDDYARAAAAAFAPVARAERRR